MREQKTVVIVDPVPERLHFFGRYLACEGLRTVLISDAVEAADQAKRAGASVVLLSADAAMAACTDGRAIADGSGARVAIYSPGTDADDVVKWVRAV